MTQQDHIQVETRPVTDFGKEWEGLVLNGEFHLRQYLGGSDHSAVFLTEYDDRDPQQAALKLIPDNPENAELQLARWELAIELSHPHLLRIFQIGRCQLQNVRLLYMVMDYAEEDLSQILPHRALTPEETRAMLPSALDALAYIHEQGLAHCRIKPSNIMASGDELKLSVDGLCRIGEPASEFNPCAPPEAKSAGSCPAGDVWSLGMALVEVLTQRLPVWERLEQKDPTVPQSLPAPFFDIARNCLRHDPRRRWTISDVALGLQASPAREKQDTPTARPTISKRPSKKNHIMPALIIIALALTAVVTGTKLLKPGPNKRNRPSLDAASSLKKKNAQEHLKSAVAPGTESTPENKLRSSRTSSSSVSSQTEKRKVATNDATHNEGIHQVLPDVPQKARDTIQGTVRVTVRVSVDASGSVTQADLDSPGPSRYFGDLALRAARQWQFSPAKVDEGKSSSEWTLRFEFSATGTRAVPTQIVPPGR